MSVADDPRALVGTELGARKDCVNYDSCEPALMETDMGERDQIVPVVLTDGTVVHISATPLGGDEDVADLKSALSFGEVSRTVESFARELSTCFDRVSPDRASIEFGIEVAVEAGNLTALIVKGSAKGNLKIVLSWDRAKG